MERGSTPAHHVSCSAQAAPEIPAKVAAGYAAEGRQRQENIMASDDNKTKADPVQKKDAQPKTKSTADAAPSKAEGVEKDAGSSSGYHRGEGQKPVSQAYKDNWNLIYGKKKKR
jgi:hypothetical protein